MLIGEGQFLEHPGEMYKAINLIKSLPKKYSKNASPTVQHNIPLEGLGSLFFQARIIYGVDSIEKLCLFDILLESNIINTNSSTINVDWYNKANNKSREFFEEITTDEVREFWKKNKGV